MHFLHAFSSSIFSSSISQLLFLWKYFSCQEFIWVSRARTLSKRRYETWRRKEHKFHTNYFLLFSFSFLISLSRSILDCNSYKEKISKSWKNIEIIFCITNEISFTIISLSSSDKFFLESWFSSWNYYFLTNYHWNLLRFTLYIRS